jgi:hypothetical protein
MFAARAAFTGAKYAVGLAGNCGVSPRSVSPTADNVKLVVNAAGVTVDAADVDVDVDVDVVVVDLERMVA